MSALAAAALAVLADPNLSTEVTWDPKDGGQAVTVRGVFAERPRTPKVLDPRDQPHNGPTLRVALSAFDPTRDGRALINGRTFAAVQWDRSRDGVTWFIELEEKGV